MPKLRYDCRNQGCFNIKRRPKIEVFDDCFPGLNAFGDVDGLIERGGAFCLLEWKGAGGRITGGQKGSYRKFTKWRGNIVFVVNGDAQTMAVTSYFIFWNGKEQPLIQASLEDIKDRLRQWDLWATSKKSG